MNKGQEMEFMRKVAMGAKPEDAAQLLGMHPSHGRKASELMKSGIERMKQKLRVRR